MESSPTSSIVTPPWYAIRSSSGGLRHIPRKDARSAHRHDVRSITKLGSIYKIKSFEGASNEKKNIDQSFDHLWSRMPILSSGVFCRVSTITRGQATCSSGRQGGGSN